jgi:hypothetical protein
VDAPADKGPARFFTRILYPIEIWLASNKGRTRVRGDYTNGNTTNSLRRQPSATLT